MIEFLENFLHTLISTVRDVFPIAVILVGFQLGVLRQRLKNPKQIIIGFVYVILGLTLFLEGLEQALFPLGKLMAEQLTDPHFLGLDLATSEAGTNWHHYMWVYLFAAAIGFSTAIAEPALIAVAIKASSVSGGAVHPWGLRVAVAFGAAIGIALGSYRIITGIPLHYFIIAAYVVVIVQTVFAPKMIIPLAYDSGGVTTSTVTVPLVAALGLGLSSNIPGRSPLLDGFGLIAFAALFPIMTVMGYAQLGVWYAKRAKKKAASQREAGG